MQSQETYKAENDSQSSNAKRTLILKMVVPANRIQGKETTQLLNDFQNSIGSDSIDLIPYEMVKIKLSEDEKQQRKVIYRKQYNKRADVKEKREMKNKIPEVIEARKKYASQDEVVVRKQILSKGRRLMLQKFKEENPKQYYEYRNLYIPPVERKRKSESPDNGKNKKRKLNK